MHNEIVAAIAVAAFVGWAAGYVMGWRQRGGHPLDNDMRCERHRRYVVGLPAKIGCELCGKGPTCALGIGENIEQRARRQQ